MLSCLVIMCMLTSYLARRTVYYDSRQQRPAAWNSRSSSSACESHQLQITCGR